MKNEIKQKGKYMEKRIKTIVKQKEHKALV